jgi:hypothetical protein
MKFKKINYKIWNSYKTMQHNLVMKYLKELWEIDKCSIK